MSFRPERPSVEAGEVATRVAGLWGLKAEDLKLSCRGWEGKGILALMLEAGEVRRFDSPGLFVLDRNDDRDGRDLPG